MVKRGTVKITLNTWGEYLGQEEGCFLVRDRWSEVKKYPFMEQQVNEVILRSGNTVSTNALATLASWGVDVYIMTPNLRPIGVLKNLDDYSNVKTRVAQYEALKNEKGINIAKQFVLGKINGQKKVLEKYRLKETYNPVITVESDDLKQVRKYFVSIEGNYASRYYKQIFMLFPESIRIKHRRAFKAYDGLNNIFNLGYEMLKWRINRALINAKLEPYLGFLHSTAVGKPSLTCDFQELYRYLIDDFLIQYCQKLKKKDFTMKSELISKNKIGYRIFPNDLVTDDLMEKINLIFERVVIFPKMRVGEKQTIGNLIEEEGYIFAKYLRNERNSWTPRIPCLN